MKYFSKADKKAPKVVPGATNYPIFSNDTAPCPDCNASVNVYHCEEYPPPGIHSDNEGFYVIRGSGMAQVGEEEAAISAGSFFYAPAGVPHTIKKDIEAPELEVILFHFPA